MARARLLHADLADENASRRLAEDLAVIARRGDVIALVGDLGTGKSTFARAFLRARAGDDGLEVPSPTFTLVQPYEIDGLTIHHFDLYRLSGPDELGELGFDEAVQTGVVLVEWPERAAGRMPDSALILRLNHAGTGRSADLLGETDVWGQRLERTRKIRKMLDNLAKDPRRRPMPGDAAVNRLERVETAMGRLIVLDWPERPRVHLLPDGRLPAEARCIQTKADAVVAVCQMLRAKGFTAPDILDADLDAGLVIASDLGNARIVSENGPIPERYRDVVNVLAELAATAFPREVPLEGRPPHRIPAFDRLAYEIELALFLDWGLKFEGHPADDHFRAEFMAAWSGLIEDLLAAPQVLCLHDLIAPNILYQPAGSTPRERIGLIDTQDAFFGPDGYDLASLVCDVRLDVPVALKDDLIARYAAARQDGDLAARVAVISAQRLTKIWGGFAALALKDGRPGHLVHVPRLKDYLRRGLAHPALAPVAGFYKGLL